MGTTSRGYMATILTPGFLKWDGFKFVLDDSIEGEPGPPGLDGLSALVYRPGGVQIGNVYSSWTDLMAKRITIDSPLTIVIDNSIQAAAVDAGVWNLGNNTAIAGYKGPVDHANLPVLTIPDGAQLQNPSDFENIEIFGNNNTFSSIVADGETNFVMNVNARNTVFATSNASTFSLFLISEDGDDDTTMRHTFNLYGASRIEKRVSSSIPVIQNDTTTTVDIHLYDNSTLDGYTLKFNGEVSEYTLHIHDWGVTYSTDQPQTTSLRYIIFPDGNIIDLNSGYTSADGTISLGKDNSIPGGQTRCIFFGQDHTVQGTGSWNALLGGESSTIGNNVTASAIIASRYSSIGNDLQGAGVFAGSSNGASNSCAVTLGGQVCFASGIRSATVGGTNSQAIGESSVTIGGDQASAGGDWSVVLGGEQCQTAAPYSVAMGYQGKTSRSGQFSHGINGGFLNGPNQYSRTLGFGSALSGGSITLTPNLLLENGKAYAIRATVIANRQTVASRAMFVNTILAHCTSGTAVIDVNTATTVAQNGTSWTIAYTISGASIVATFTATGSGGGSTVNAVVTYEWVEAGGGA